MTSVRADDGGYTVESDEGHGSARAVVLASGGCSLPTVPDFAVGRAGRCGIAHAHGLQEPGAARRRWRPRGRRVGHRAAARRGDPALRPPGNDLRRRARAHAPDLPWPGHLLVDGCHRPARRALRRGGRHHPGPQRAVATARRHAGAHEPGPELAPGHRRRGPGAAGSDQGRPGAVLGWPPEQVHPRGPQDAPPAGHDRRVGPGARLRPRRSVGPADGDGGEGRSADARPDAVARSGRSSGRRASAPTSHGSTCRCSTTRAASATTAASWRPRPACTSSARRSCGGDGRASSTARATTPRSSSDHLAAHLAG